MIITKEDIFKLMRKTIDRNWFEINVPVISIYEQAITCISGGFENENYIYEGKEEDIDKIVKHINEYPDFKIENIYDIIYKYKPWNFFKCSKFE